MSIEPVLAKQVDLKTHLHGDPKTAHGIVDFIAELSTIRVKAAFRAYAASSQLNLTANTWTKINIDTKNFDYGSNFDTTNKRFVAPVAGYYQINCAGEFTTRTNSATYEIAIYVNGAAVSVKRYSTNAAGDAMGLVISDVVRLAAGDYVEMFMKSNNASTNDTLEGSIYTYMSGCILCRDL
jgi:hypothetical protein